MTIMRMRNRLLASLPPDAVKRLAPHLQRVNLSASEVIYSSAAQIEFVYFIEAGFVSKVVRFASGDVAEVGMVGREGLIGLPLIFGADAEINDAIVQWSGYAHRIDGAALSSEMGRNAPLRAIVLRYALAFLHQVSQTAACNGRHTLEQRFVRWLLMAHDRAESDVLPVTHEFMSMMLGVRRSGVTVAAGAVQRRGFVSLSRGVLTVLNRLGLEQMACECYRTTLDEYERLITNARVL